MGVRIAVKGLVSTLVVVSKYVDSKAAKPDLLNGKMACYPTAWNANPRYGAALRKDSYSAVERALFKTDSGVYDQATAFPGQSLTFAYPSDK